MSDDLTEAKMNAQLGITSYALSNDDLLAIGRIIRGCAEIEDIISIHLCQVADISEGQLLVLLGRANITTKLELAGKLAKAKGGAAWEAHQACFNIETFKQLLRCRNAVAHGVLLGKCPEGFIVFLTAAAKKSSDDLVTVAAQRFAPEDLQRLAANAEELIPQYDNFLRTKQARSNRL